MAFGPALDPARAGGAEGAENLAQLARDCDVIFLGLATQEEVRAALFGPAGLAPALAAGKIVIDQSAGEPDQSAQLGAELDKIGVVLLDAPIHTESTATLPETAAILCGGPAGAVARLRPLLESICPVVIHCGDAGAGQATRLVVAAVAACNRLVTYECAAVGVQNGLAIEHMAKVLNGSSGYNSGSARILPVLASGGDTADVTLGAVAADLKMASRLAMRCGAPLMVANLAGSILEGAASELGDASGYDEARKIVEAAAGISFQDARTWAPTRL